MCTAPQNFMDIISVFGSDNVGPFGKFGDIENLVSFKGAVFEDYSLN